MAVATPKKNLELGQVVTDIIDAERLAGTTMTRTVQAAIHWYINRLTAQQRELARAECAEWLMTGVIPDPGLAMEMDRLLHEVRRRLVRLPASQKKVAGKSK